jgi:lipopolysaccharide transport system ATP-binding protein
MSNVITVDNLGKKYTLCHQQREAQASLRDMLSNRISTLGSRLFSPFSGSRSETTDFEDFWALSEVSFQVKEGERIGIIGKNGAGKSTLLKILSRITEPTTGSVRIRGRVASLLEVGTGFHPELTGRENIYLNGAILGMSRQEIRNKFDEIVDFAEIEKFLDTPVKRYSSGMYVRLAFAVAAHLEPEILIVDEVLAVGDAKFQKKCLGKMQQVGEQGRTIFMVSHNMMAIRNLCNKTINFHAGRIEFFGPAEQGVALYLRDVSGKIVSERCWPAPEVAPGNATVRLRRVAIVPEPGGAVDGLSVNHAFSIETEYWNLQPDLKLSLSMHLVTQDDLVAFATTTWREPSWQGKAFPVGVFRSTCQFPGGLLNTGPYSLRFFFIDAMSKMVCRIDDTICFELADSPHDRGGWVGGWTGAVRPNLDWNTELVT